jgi:hypothetical protein
MGSIAHVVVPAVGPFGFIVNTMFSLSLSSTSQAKAWRTSRFSDLPELSVEASDTTNNFLIVAGGLSLLLSRTSAENIRRSYASTVELHLLLTRELRRHGRTSAGAELLNDVLHEAAHLVDPATRAALKSCFEARVAYEGQRRSRLSSGSAPLSNNPFTAEVGSISQALPSVEG